jgi:ribosomal-protein-alanine N-acetyltransferase
VPPIPRLETDRLLLTVPPRSAAPRLVQYLLENREHFSRWSPRAGPDALTVPYWESRLEVARSECLNGRSAHFYLFRRGDEAGGIVGQCSFSEIVRGAFQACYLGYRIAAREEGQGLMEEALRAAIPWALDALSLHRIMANYVPTNERSGRLLRKLGFTVEGYARDYLFIDGAWRDHVLTSITSHTLLEPGAS